MIESCRFGMDSTEDVSKGRNHLKKFNNIKPFNSEFMPYNCIFGIF